MLSQPILRLPCKLTPYEKEKRSDELARSLEAHEALKLEKSDAMQRLNLKIKESERKIYDLGEVLRTGFELRGVPVEYRPNFEKNLVECFRSDTGVNIGGRPMEYHERQLELAGAGAERVAAAMAADEDADPSEVSETH